MKKEKISVLGCGWLGLPLAETLVKQGYEVCGSTTSPEKLQQLKEKQIRPFLLDLNTLQISPENQEFFNSEILIVNVPPKRISGNPYAQQIRNLQLDLQNTTVKHIIFVSSTSVYSSSSEIITEESPLDHESAKELIEAEMIIAATGNSWKTTILRFAGLFGPGREPGRFLAGKTELPAPDAPVNLIHLHDCIRIIQEIIKQKIWNEVFNACADEHPTREKFYTEAARKLHLPEPVFSKKMVGNEPQKLISNQKLRTILKYEFQYPDPIKAL